MTREEQIFAYKELRNNGQVFIVDNYEDADRIIEALENQAEHDAKIINKFAEELKSRLGDAIYPKDFESMKNLIDDVAKEGVTDGCENAEKP